MQIERKLYDKNLHDIYNALSVKQPYADLLVKPVAQDDNGRFIAEKTIEVRSRTTNYRGDLLVCSSALPVMPGRESGVTLGLVELYEVKPVEQFTADDWERTCIPAEERAKIKKGYGWMMRNPRRVIEMPIKGQLGVYKIVVPKGDITEYPVSLEIGEDGFEIIKNKANEKED